MILVVTIKTCQQFIKILKFHNCIDFFQKFLNENMQRRNKYKVHDREISSHLFNILNVWSIRILHIFFFFMLPCFRSKTFERNQCNCEILIFL
jgi:hypothetical protein